MQYLCVIVFMLQTKRFYFCLNARFSLRQVDIYVSELPIGNIRSV